MRKATRHDAGDLSHRFILEAREEEPDGFGGRLTTLAPKGAIWGSPRTLRGRESTRAAQLDEVVDHAVTVRFRADIRPGWRLRRGARSFDVIAVYDPDERRRYLVLETRERPQ